MRAPRRPALRVAGDAPAASRLGRSRIGLTTALVLAAIAWAAIAAGAAPPPSPSPDPPSDPPGQATFLVVADTHFNDHALVPEFSPANRAVIEALNGLPGRAYPPEIGGVVAAPRGVLVLGDLTDGGKPVQWRGRWFWRGGFDLRYPRDGVPGAPDRVRWPVYALPGNHDRAHGRTLVPEALAQRYGGLRYALDWGPIRLLVVGSHADAEGRAWLAAELARTPAGQAVLLCQHYSFPGSAFGGEDERWWTAREKQELASLLAGGPVVAILHGHAHTPEHYRWAGLPVLNPGSAEHNRTLAVVRASATRIDTAWYQVEADPSGRWTGGAWVATASLPAAAGD